MLYDEGAELFPWEVENDEYVAVFRCDPEFKEPMETKRDRATLRSFFHYLEKNGKVKVDMECHTIKRIQPKSKDDLSTYEISCTEKCGFRPKSGTGPKTMLGNITPTTMKGCKHACFTTTLKYVDSENMIVPGKPKLLLVDSVKVLANTIVKL